MNLDVVSLESKHSPQFTGHIVIQKEIHALGSLICSATSKLISSR